MGDYTVETALRRFRETTEDEGTTDIPRPMLDGLVAFGYLTRRRAGPHGYVYTETAKATALLARQEGEDAILQRISNPHWWSPEMSKAWHNNIPDMTMAFSALIEAARSGGGG